VPDRAEQITKKLRTALREESRERRNLNESVSLGVQSGYARRYIEAHMAVKILREALINELGVMEPKLEDLLGEEPDGPQEKA
jgi:hypothetical protein